MTTLTQKRRTTLAALSHRRRTQLRQRRSGSRIARAVLAISFIILVGRFAYSSVSAFFHHQDKQQRIEQTVIAPSFSTTDTPFKQKE